MKNRGRSGGGDRGSRITDVEFLELTVNRWVKSSEVLLFDAINAYSNFKSFNKSFFFNEIAQIIFKRLW